MEKIESLRRTKTGERIADVLMSQPEKVILSFNIWLETFENPTEQEVRVAASSIIKITDQLDIMKILYLIALQPKMKTYGLCWLFLITGEPVNDVGGGGDEVVDVHVTYETLEELDVIQYCFKIAEGKYLVPSCKCNSYVLLEDDGGILHVSQANWDNLEIPLQEVDTTELAERRVAGLV